MRRMGKGGQSGARPAGGKVKHIITPRRVVGMPRGVCSGGGKKHLVGEPWKARSILTRKGGNVIFCRTGRKYRSRPRGISGAHGVQQSKCRFSAHVQPMAETQFGSRRGRGETGCTGSGQHGGRRGGGGGRVVVRRVAKLWMGGQFIQGEAGCPDDAGIAAELCAQNL